MDSNNRVRTSGSSQEGTVWVVDGDGGVRESLGALLRTLPVNVVTFPDGESLLEALGDSAPGFLITELSLPGMTGLELMAALRDRGLFIPTLALTADAREPDRMAAARLGCLNLIEKPFVFWAVVQSVRDVLHLQPS